MENNTILKQIQALREEVRKHDILFDERKQVLSDPEYDKLYKKLEELESQYPEYYDANSPTQKITAVFERGLKKVTHSVPMLSQDKVHTEEDIRKFCKKADISKGIVVSQKLDGLTIVSTHSNHQFVSGVTRGDGILGEEVSANIAQSQNLPKTISFNGLLETRGEAIIPFADFDRINKELLEQGVDPENLYKTSRNLASGTLRTLEGTATKDRGVRFVAFDLIQAQDMEFSLDTERLQFLSEQGFEVVPYEVFYDVDKLVEYCLSYNEKVRPNLPYPIDGLILTYNDLSIREELGFTSKYPRWGCAFKFEDEVASTILNEVVWTVGRTGKCTPNGHFNSVELDGTTVSKASLHNLDNIQARNIKLNAHVLVIKANQIIPQIVSVVEGSSTGKEEDILPPTTCPVCGGAIHRINVDFFCTNPLCSQQLTARLIHFTSRNALNIDGFGEKTAEDFLKQGIITSLTDVLDLKEKLDEITKLKGYGKKTALKLFDNIEKAKSSELNKVLVALGIPNVGENTSKILAKHYSSMDILLEKSKNTNAFKEELATIDDIGSITAQSIVSFLIENEDFILTLKEKGMTMVQPVVENVEVGNLTLEGKTFVVTGEVIHFNNRKEIEAKIESLGGKLSKSVSSKTHYLINNDTASLSSKNKKAKELNVPIISEEDFLAMIK